MNVTTIPPTCQGEKRQSTTAVHLDSGMAPRGSTDARRGRQGGPLRLQLAPRGPGARARARRRLAPPCQLADGASIADPFRRTAEARDLLDLRVKQLRRGARRPPRPRAPPAGARRLARRPDRRPPPRPGPEVETSVDCFERGHRETRPVELLPVELGGLAGPTPDDRLSAAVDLVGEPVTGVDPDARDDRAPASRRRGRRCCGRRSGRSRSSCRPGPTRGRPSAGARPSRCSSPRAAPPAAQGTATETRLKVAATSLLFCLALPTEKRIFVPLT